MLNLTRGILITFEGTEGSGKSTLISQVLTLFQSHGLSCIATREPGGSELAEKIRNLLLNSEMDPRTELLLYEAARSNHLNQVILPALKQNQLVLCDRFTDSTLAYQSQARGLPWAEVKRLNQFATQGLKPNLTVFLDLAPEIGLSRAQDPNRFEKEGLDFHKQVRQGFLRSRKETPQRWFTLALGRKANPKDESPRALAEILFQEFKKRFRRSLTEVREVTRKTQRRMK